MHVSAGWVLFILSPSFYSVERLLPILLKEACTERLGHEELPHFHWFQQVSGPRSAQNGLESSTRSLKTQRKPPESLPRKAGAPCRVRWRATEEGREM